MGKKSNYEFHKSDKEFNFVLAIFKITIKLIILLSLNINSLNLKLKYY